MKNQNKNFQKGVVLTALLSIFAIACSSSSDSAATDEATTSSPICTPTVTISTLISGTETIAADTCAALKGQVSVTDGGTLTINAGATIVADTGTFSYLLVKQGGTLNISGTAAKPVTFTSSASVGSRGASDWGGIVIHGKAQTNSVAGVNTATDTEIGTGPYGGSTAADNSGTMTYFRLQFAGREIAAGKEFNGLFLAGVGSGTTINHVHVHKGSDDGIEIFGGTVNLNDVVLTDNEDDGFDLDDGWHGYAQRFIISNGPKGDNCIEYDGQGKDAGESTQAMFANFTLVGTSGNTENSILTVKKSGAVRMANFYVANFVDQFIAVSADSVTLASGGGQDPVEAFYADAVNRGAGTYDLALINSAFEAITINSTLMSDVGATSFLCGNAGSVDDGSDCTGPSNQAAATALFPDGATNLTVNTTITTGLTAQSSWDNASEFAPTSAPTGSTASNTNMTAWNGSTLTIDNWIGAIQPGGTNWANGWTDYPAN